MPHCGRKACNLSRNLSYTSGMRQEREVTPTQPPGPADEAAMAQAKKLAREGDGSEAFFACAYAMARKLGIR